MAYEWHCLDRVGTQEEFGALLGISQAAVSQAMRDGVIQKGETLKVWLLNYLAKLRAAASGRATGDAGTLLTQARIREANAKAFKAEVETGKELGALVLVRDVEPALRNWAARGSQAIDSAAQRIIDAIESEHSIRLEDRHVRDHLRAAQRDIAAYADELGAAADADLPGLASARTGTDG